MNDFKRKVELVIVNYLAAQIPGGVFLPSKGGSDSSPDTDIVPPYTVVEVTDANKRISTEQTFYCTVMVTFITHIDDTSAPQHSQLFRTIYNTLAGMPSGFDADQQVMLHGSDIEGTNSVEDEANKSHGDTITLNLGASDVGADLVS